MLARHFLLVNSSKLRIFHVLAGNISLGANRFVKYGWRLESGDDRAARFIGKNISPYEP
jgi:hypothetical protein